MVSLTKTRILKKDTVCGNISDCCVIHNADDENLALIGERILNYGEM